MSNPPNRPTGAKPSDRHIPKEVRFITRGFVYRGFPWRERFKILLGYRALLEVHVMSEHNPGQSQPKVKFNLTSKLTQAEALIELRERVAQEQAANGVEPNTLPEKEGIQ